MSRFLLALPLALGTALMALPADEPAAKNPTDDQLAKMFRDWLDEEFKRHPVFATQQGNHDYDDQMDDLSPEARKRDRDRGNITLRSLNQVRREDLSQTGKIDRDIWHHAVEY